MDAADVVRGLDMEVTLDDGELVETAVLVTKIIDADGEERISVSYPPRQSWITRRGMLEASADAARDLQAHDHDVGEDD